ncbi:hypothetical protein SLW70_16480 [Flavobacterium sp. NG2]|uniref:hypothetical protein n=1 Tax=Flavobacterium sp. NG2 TaxID=3097547 RepID=UPI002A83534A|nr:hypothetical protein [Flavobacterium sp. NG2]WPR71511.1 hypothetical protein SLW70_16480 [Flavobacterium sp. NG2]
MKSKNNIRITFTLAISLLFTYAINAQKTEAAKYDQGFRLGFGLNAGVPTDEDVYNYALGADARLQYDLSKKTSLILTTGFTNLFISNDRKDLGIVPVKAGFKAFVWEDQFYVLGEVGGAFAVTNGANQHTYLYAPGIGYATKYIDVSVRYEGYTEYDTNQVALRLAYGFKL